MRKILPFLCVLISVTAGANTADSIIKVRFSGYGAYGIPLGKFAWQSGGQFVTGLCMPTFGGGLSAAYFISPRFTIGMNISTITYRLQEEQLYAQLYNRYADINYYTRIKVSHADLDVPSMALTGSYLFKTRFATIEPYLHLGVGFISEGYFGDTYYVYRKKKNEHYFESISPGISGGSFFYPGIGLQLNKRIWRSIFFNAAIQYNYGKLNYVFTERSNDFFDKTTVTTQPATQVVSAMQINAGVSVWVNRKYISNFISIPKKQS